MPSGLIEPAIIDWLDRLRETGADALDRAILSWEGRQAEEIARGWLIDTALPDAVKSGDERRLVRVALWASVIAKDEKKDALERVRLEEQPGWIGTFARARALAERTPPRLVGAPPDDARRARELELLSLRAAVRAQWLEASGADPKRCADPEWALILELGAEIGSRCGDQQTTNEDAADLADIRPARGLLVQLDARKRLYGKVSSQARPPK